MDKGRVVKEAIALRRQLKFWTSGVLSFGTGSM